MIGILRARPGWACGVVLLLFPVLVQITALTGWFDTDPMLFNSGLLVAGQPGPVSGSPAQLDPNAGWTTQALGTLSAHLWLQGEIPWWNPYTGVGLPLAGEMQSSAMFLPFILLLALPKGVLLLKISLQIVAGLCSLALFRRLSLSWRAALVSAMLVQIKGTFAWMGHAPMLPMAFLPMLLVGIEQARDGARTGRLAGWRVVALAIAFSLYAGFPEVAYLNGLFALVWAIYRLVGLPPGARRSFVAAVGGGGAIGLLLAVPLLLAFFQYLAMSEVSIRTNYGVLRQLAAGYAQYLFPYVLGPIAAFSDMDPKGLLVHLWGRTGGFIGMAVFLYAALGAFGQGRQRGLRRVLLGWVVVALAKTAGLPGLVQVLNLLPFFTETQVFRYANPSWEFAAITLAAFCIDDHLRGTGLAGRRLNQVLAGVAGLAAVAVALSVPLAWRMVGHAPGFGRYYAGSLAAGAVVFLAGWGAAVLARRHRRIAPLLALPLLEGVVLFGLTLLAGVRGGVLDLEPVRFLQTHLGLQRFVALGPIAPNYPALFGIAAINTSYLPIDRRWAEHVRFLDPEADPTVSMGDFPPGAAAATARLHALQAHLPDYEAMGVRYIVAPSGSGWPDRAYALPSGPATARAWTLEPKRPLTGTIPANAVPVPNITGLAVMIGTFAGRADGMLRAELCAAGTCAHGQATLAGAIDNQKLAVLFPQPLAVPPGTALRFTLEQAGGTHPVAIWLDRAVADGPQVEATPDDSPRLSLFAGAGIDAPVVFRDTFVTIAALPGTKPYFEAASGGPCTFTRQRRTGLVAQCAAPARLVRRELLSPGWHATVNGQDAPIEAEPPLFQAIALPQGESRIRFRYVPPHMGFGYAAFAAGLVLLAGAGWGWRRLTAAR